MHADQVRAVVTPDAVPLELDTATVGTRAVAALIDLSIIATALLLIAIAEAIFGVSGFVPGWLALTLLLLLGTAIQFGYPIGFETLTRGRTPGKMVMGLRVVTVEGGPVSLRHAAIRAMLGVIELLGTIGAVAVISSLISPRSQRLGDLAAGTLVIRERGARGRTTAERFLPPPGLEELTARLDVSGLRPADYATLRETLLRLPSLPPPTAQRIAGDVAARLAPRVRPGPPNGVAATDWLRCVAAAVQARRIPGGPVASSGAAPVGAATGTWGPAPASPPSGPSLTGPPLSGVPLSGPSLTGPPPSAVPPAAPPPAVPPAGPPPADGGFAPPQ